MGKQDHIKFWSNLVEHTVQLMLIFYKGLRKTLPRPSASRQEELKRCQIYALQAPGIKANNKTEKNLDSTYLEI